MICLFTHGSSGKQILIDHRYVRYVIAVEVGCRVYVGEDNDYIFVSGTPGAVAEVLGRAERAANRSWLVRLFGEDSRGSWTFPFTA